MNLRHVAASRQKAANPRNHFQRRSSETPLRRGSWSRCTLEATWRLSTNRAVDPKVLECAGSAALYVCALGDRKRRRTAALQDAGAATNTPNGFKVPMHVRKRIEAFH